MVVQNNVQGLEIAQSGQGHNTEEGPASEPPVHAGRKPSVAGGVQLVPVNRATNVAITLRQFSDCSIADIRRGIVSGQMKSERVSLLRMVLPCLPLACHF